jgi:hypothetical protein
MSAALEVAAPVRPEQTGPRWLVSQRDDLVWFIGSAAVGYLALTLFALGFPPQPIVLFWLIGVDGPHVFATATRSHFDRVERAKLGPWIWAFLPLMCVGPLFTLAGYHALFLVLAVTWQHFHIAKQHVGFVMLWRAKNAERDMKDMQLDKRMILTSTMLPLIAFLAWTELPHSQALTAAIGVAALGWLALGVRYAAVQIRRWRRGESMNTPKLLLQAVVPPLYAWAFYSAAQLGPEGIIRAGVAVGLFHSLQYHRLLWFHNKNRHRGPDASERHGPVASALAGSAVYYALAALGLNWVLSVTPTVLVDSDYVSAAVWGFAFSHYLLDAKIWHVRSDKELAQALGFAPRA